MANVRTHLEQMRNHFAPRPGGFERLVARRDRRVRTQRVVAASVALALSAGLFVGLWNLWNVNPMPSSPGPGPDRGLTIQVGGSPVDVAMGEGSVWVATATDSSGRGNVVRIDPTGGRIVARIPLPEIGALTAAEGSVWVVNLRGGTVTRIDSATNEPTDVIDMPSLLYEVAEGDREFVPESIQSGFGRIWISTARGAVASIDPISDRAVLSAGDPQAILGGVATSRRWVWAWNVFEPPDAEVWRFSPESPEIEGIGVPDVVLDAAAGSAGLYLLHAETGDVSFISEAGQHSRLGSAGERANAIAALDSTVYLAAASGSIYAIDGLSGERRLLKHLPQEPIALAVAADGLWVTAGDGTVTEVVLGS